MSRSSPGVARVAAILNFIADHPGQAFALTDLVRALKLSRATCHALLTGLVDVGYLYRTTDKTYVLGPALAAIGRTAADHFSPLQVAQPEMRSLADEFDVVCGAYFLESDTIHLRERAASLSHVGYPVPLGTRMPLRWIQAMSFFARSPREAESWIARAEPDLGPEQLDLFRGGLDFVREHGFIALVRRPGTAAMDEVQGIGAGTEDPPVVPQLTLQDDKVYPLMALMAPIYDSRNRVTISLVMAGFHGAMTGPKVTEAGRRLAEACERISVFLSGRAASAD
ncbi:IclR family transcriptional regulator [Novosphingobium mangrovi (ex Huang et al. 2023)]|uniref:Helix-turn-helix domain-containing protein n=1 Tax=Novosphingobium mangrovi (ex Huang et al. 2023) TaxID=2976432 RepID=A0ABT2I4P9_9SPHN|nr:helix-turn-helix domain-containing protein [Novosphingobium mangrovi (ex Huang et al. 2023)]MCT2399795.1 helix-turn-helix domain-containing protein [Novosphingobium mangrovi (ex Huang et al. 2023)]